LRKHRSSGYVNSQAWISLAFVNRGSAANLGEFADFIQVTRYKLLGLENIKPVSQRSA
jgi:hypothetical protein